jgi:transposase
MGLTTKRPKLELTQEEIDILRQKSNSRTLPKQEVLRSKVLMLYYNNESISEIERQVGLSRPSIYKCIDKALAGGIDMGLKDKYHRSIEPVITESAKLWVINLACTKPKDHGYAAEIWSYSALAAHTRKHAPASGHECLSKAVKATIHRIIKSHPVQPHKMKYYLEKRDLDFDKKMEEVLIVYQEVNAQNEATDEEKQVITISVDEKPGVQAIKNIAPDLPPKPGKHKSWSRDYEYKRLGTLSILAALDLHDGHVIAQVHKRHRSKEFILLLKEIDDYYPKDKTIRIILDNHSSHISKETMNYLKTRPNRFQYVHTPKHGSWLNLVETLFGKMARTFLNKIRVESISELKDRILQGIQEINENPVIHRWSKFEIANNNL